MDDATRVLLIYPRFNSFSFWNYRQTCELVGARYPTAPLGLITVAALLPASWRMRLVNRNTEDLTEADLDWADLVLTGGMMVQQPDTLRLIAMCRARGKPVVVGGPDATSSPHIYEDADFRILGEAEAVIDAFVEAWRAGARTGVFTSEPYKVDITKTPIPRFDLLKLDQYLFIGVQYSRGCPFTCEFCDIIELYGRAPRTKTNAQMLAELDALYALGYRGHVDFVDDNLVGNKKAVKSFLAELAAWLQRRDYPFEFSTEASVNLADDAELLAGLTKANFFAVFVGIETPNADTLVATRKRQNTRRGLVESVHRIYAAGLFVTAGFIVGFDAEKRSVAEEMIGFIQDAAIPISLVSLLTALPNTQLTRRLTSENRLHPDHDRMPEGANDTFSHGLNFDTLRPERAILADYVKILEGVFEPSAYCERLKRLARLLDRSGQAGVRDGGRESLFNGAAMVKALLERLPGERDLFRKTFFECASINPRAVKYIVMLMAFYLHLGRFSRQMTEEIGRRIAALPAAGLHMLELAEQDGAA